MFNIKLVDINGDGLVVDADCYLGTLAEVEIMVTQSINEYLGITNTVLVYNDDLTYIVYVNGRDIGLVVIKDVNAPTHKRK